MSGYESAGTTKCDACGDVSPYESWADARAAGWWCGTGGGPPDFNVLLCPDCNDQQEGREVGP